MIEIMSETFTKNHENSIRCPVRLSIVLPFYKKFQDFNTAIHYNERYFSAPTIEVVVVLDEPSEMSKVLELTRGKYPKIKWRILVNDRPHQWRAPAKAINVGIRNSLGDVILVASPESVFVDNPVPAADCVSEGNCFVIGRVVFCTRDQFENSLECTREEVFERRQKTRSIPLFYGSILARREHFTSVKGYTMKV
jgi:hypothetical protein